VWQPAFTNVAAAGHDAAGRVKDGRRLYAKANAAYSLYCTADDYAKFVLEMMNPDRSAPHSIRAESLRAMLTPASPSNGSKPITRRGSTGEGEIRYGLGWAIEPTASGPRIRHSGANGTGFRSHVEFDPARGHGIVIMTNGEGGAELWKELVAWVGEP
jgi:CubicO group peptidase (beta-lactamase class C family)